MTVEGETSAKPPGKAHSVHRRVLRGGSLLVAGKAVSQGCSFLRNVIVARAIGVENFGIAATFAITVAIFDMIGNLSVDRLLIQAKDGNDERFQSAAHMLQAIRGIVSGLLIAAAAPLIARLFGVPQTTWAFRYLALIPVLRGFAHLDNQRVQRDLQFAKSVGLDIAQQVIPTVLAWPIAVVTKDYSAMLWLVLIQGAIATAGSFLIANRAYRWHWDAGYSRRMFHFGWPIVVNAIFLLGIYQGDRLLIGTAGRTFGTHTYTLADLGVYSVATSLTFTPMIAFSAISSSLLLPFFSSIQSEDAKLQRRYYFSSQLASLASGLFALPLILAGTAIVVAVYGRPYVAAGGLVGWMAAGQAIRMARVTPTLAAMSRGDSRNAMYANMLRFCAIVGVVAVIIEGRPLVWIAMIGFCGELLGLGVCLWRLECDHGIMASLGIKAVSALLACMAGAGIVAFWITGSNLVLRGSLILLFYVIFLMIMLAAFPSFRARLKSTIFRGGPGKASAGPADVRA